MGLIVDAPGGSAAETASTKDYLCVVHGEVNNTVNPDWPTRTEAYIVVDKDYAVAMIQDGDGVCPVFSSSWNFVGESRSYDYEYYGRCDNAPMDDSYGEFATNSGVCSKVAETVGGVIDSEDIGGSCVNSSSLVSYCGRYEIEIEFELPPGEVTS